MGVGGVMICSSIGLGVFYYVGLFVDSLAGFWFGSVFFLFWIGFGVLVFDWFLGLFGKC